MTSIVCQCASFVHLPSKRGRFGSPYRGNSCAISSRATKGCVRVCSLSRRSLLAGSLFVSVASCRPIMAAASEPLYEAWVKGDPKAQKLGDCPFCHRVLLTLEEKSIPYSKDYVDFADKPKWLFEVNKGGSVPVVKDLKSDKWLVDSASICDSVEAAHPEHKLGTSDSIPPVAESLFPAFKAFLQSPGPDEDARRSAAYVQQLEQIQEYLRSQSKGPFIGGQQPAAADLALGPKLYHSTVALKHFKAHFEWAGCKLIAFSSITTACSTSSPDWSYRKGFDTPKELAEVPAYLSRLQDRQSWKNTFYSEDQVIAGWASH